MPGNLGTVCGMTRHNTRTLLASLATLAFFPTMALADPVPAARIAAPTSDSKANAVCRNASLLGTSDRGRLNVNPCTVRTREGAEEMGYSNTSSSAGAHLTTAPSARTRVGIADGLELQFTAPSSQHFTGPDQTRIVGQSNTAIGAKYQFQNEGRFAHGVAVNAIMPTGTNNVTTGRPEYQESYQAGYAVSPYLTATGMVGLRQFATPSTTGGKNPVTNAFVPGVGLTARVLPKTSLGAEVQSVSSLGPGTSGSTYGNLFAQHELTHNLAVDVNAGQQFNTTLGQKTHDVGVGLGVKF